MRITILCGCLEPGRNGLGDYARKLGSAAHQLGHEVQLIAVNDQCTSQDVHTTHAPVYRFQNGLRAATYKQIEHLVEQQNSDVLSLQFVHFAYHSKGILSQLVPFIQKLRANRHLHIMIHEPWIRPQTQTPWRQRLLGWIQKYQLQQAIRIWNPDTLHTSNAHYQFVLKAAGIETDILPLFGNIDHTPLQKHKLNTQLNWPPELAKIPLILFPFSQRRDWDPIPTLKQLKAASDKIGQPLHLVQIGKNTCLQQHWPAIEQFARDENWYTHQLGPQDESLLSQLMQQAKLGISSEHIQHSGKSGAVLSMLEHGLPVLATGAHPEPGPIVPPKSTTLLLELAKQPEAITQLLTNPRATSQFHSALTNCCQQWLSDLAKGTPHVG